MANYPYKRPGTQLDDFRETIIEFQIAVEQDVRSAVGQINKLIADGDSSPQAAAAAVDMTGFAYKTLKERLDSEYKKLVNELGGRIKKINGITPDENGNVLIPTENFATKNQVGDLNNEIARIIANNGNGTKDTEVVEARNVETTIGKRLQKIETAKRIDLSESAQMKYGAKKYINPSLEIGMLYASGALTNETNRIRSKEFISPLGDMNIYIKNTDYKYAVFTYNLDGTFVSDNGFWQSAASKRFAHNPNYKYKLIIARNDNAVINLDSGNDALIITDGFNGKFVEIETPTSWYFSHGGQYPAFNSKKHTFVLQASITDMGFYYNRKRYSLVKENQSIVLDISPAQTEQSSLGVILYNYETNEFLVKPYTFYETNIKPLPYVLIATFRRSNTSYTASMICPFTVDGELFRKPGATTKQNDFIQGVAHRGYSGNGGAPENTLPAYILAKKKGYNQAETDIGWTKDGIPVLIHDYTINRTARNADGTPIEGDIYIKDITLDEARIYDFGIWKSTEYAGTQIPTFEEFIIMCKKLSIHPHIELKLIESTEHIETLIKIVRRKGMEGHVTWGGYHYDNFVKVKQIDPKASISMVIDTEVTKENLDKLISLKTEQNEVYVSLFSPLLTEEVSNRIMDAGLKLNVWSVWSAADIQRFAKYGVTSIGVDDISVSQALFDEYM